MASVHPTFLFYLLYACIFIPGPVVSAYCFQKFALEEVLFCSTISLIPMILAGFLYDVYTLNMRIFFNDSSPTTSNSISHKTSTIKPTNRNQIHSLTKPQQSRHVEVLLTDENRQLKPQHKRRA